MNTPPVTRAQARGGARETAPHSPAVVSRDQVIRNMRAVLDRAMSRVAADYAAGRLSPADTAAYERLLAKYRPVPAHRAAA